MDSQPQVSVVIPTRSRPHLVPRAVRSALAQTVTDIEVIVVIDGPDEVTRPALVAELADPRLRLVQLAASGGAPAARNAGVRHARASWVALLDDDDEWLPEKLASQLAVAAAAGHRRPIVGSRLTVRTPRGEFQLPRRLPAAAEPPSEYLTVRRGLFHGDGFIQTSSILAPTALLREVPFATGVRRFQELDWTLRCLTLPGVALVYAPQPLVIWYADENRPRITFDAGWQQSLEWLRATRPLVTPRAYGALALTVVSSWAATSGSPRVFFGLLREARRNGRPGPLDYLTHLQVWLIPTGLRRVLRDKVLTRRRPATAPQPAARPHTPDPALRRSTPEPAVRPHIPGQVRADGAADGQTGARAAVGAKAAGAVGALDPQAGAVPATSRPGPAS
jgi:glycosyltransferase involved in cell wall biosynthesis